MIRGVRWINGRWADGCVLWWSMSPRRPQAARLLEGRPVDEAVALAPRLFSLCGQAQGAAARLAAAAAQGQISGRRASVEALTRMVALESIGEHLWRLLLTGRCCSAASRTAMVSRWRKRLLAVNPPQGLESRKRLAGLAEIRGTATSQSRRDDGTSPRCCLGDRRPTGPVPRSTRRLLLGRRLPGACGNRSAGASGAAEVAALLAPEGGVSPPGWRHGMPIWFSGVRPLIDLSRLRRLA